MAALVRSESRLHGILLLCNLSCRSFLIGSLGLRSESCELGNKRCLTHAPRIKGTWWLTLHLARVVGSIMIVFTKSNMEIVQAQSHAFKLLLYRSLSVSKDLILISSGRTDRLTDSYTTASTCFTAMLFVILEANGTSKMTDILVDLGHGFTHLEFNLLWILQVVFNKSSHVQICKVSLKHYTHMWRNQLKRSNKKGSGRKRREQYVCEEGQWDTSTVCRGTQLITGTLSPALCDLSSHPLFGVVLHNKHAESHDFI